MRLSAPVRAFFVLACAAVLAPTWSSFGQGRLAEPLEGFFAPAGAVFSPDGKLLYVSNSARTDYGMLAGRGAVSVVAVGPQGQLRMAKQRLIEGLNAPVGVTLLPTRIGEFPAGTLVVAAGGRWAVKDRTTPMADARERETGLIFIDPATGARLGSAYLGAGSAVETVLGHAIADPSHVVFDSAGNTFVSDVAGLGLRQPQGTAENRPGIFRFTARALAALARGETPAAADVSFLDVPEVAGGIAWWEKDRMLYWATGPGYGDLAGAVLRLAGGEFGPGGRIDTVHKEILPMVGACLTSNGSLIVAHADGSVGVIKRGRGKVKPVRFRRPTVFLSPGQPAATTLADGTLLVIVPEMASGGRPAWRHNLQAFILPAEY